jgi:hypothetical protein
MICVIVDLCVSPEHMAQFADDSDRVYAEIFKTAPGFLYGALATRPEDARAIAVVFFESAEAFHAAEPLFDGAREAMAISPGGTFTLLDYEVIVRGVGVDAEKLFSPIPGSGPPGAPA